MLQVLDTLWKEHLATMDHLRQGIHLRAYAQKNPKQEYKRESFELFEELLTNLKYEVIKFLSHVQIQSQDEASRSSSSVAGSARASSWLSSMRRPLGWQRTAVRRGEPRNRRRRKPLPESSPRSVATSPAPVAVARSTSSARQTVDRSRSDWQGRTAMAVGPDSFRRCSRCPGCAWLRWRRHQNAGSQGPGAD